jgi:putative NADPH-quinone reductase
MHKNICLIQGHPHSNTSHLCHALASAYEEGALGAGANIHRLELATMDIAFLRDPEDFAKPPPRDILDAQDAVRSADHLFIIYPLWMGTMPALVKAFFEQLSRNDFAISENKEGGWPKKMLKGKSARVVVTMGMPSAAYKIFFGAHGVKGFESGILGLSGFKPIRETLIGGVGELSPKQLERHLARMRSYGARSE